MIRTLLLAALLAPAAAGCSSAVGDRILGRWKADPTQTGEAAADIVWEFTDEGAFTIYRVRPGAAGPGDRLSGGRFALGFGNTVKFTGLNPPLAGKTTGNEHVAVDGDTMTVGRPDQKTYTFTRLPPPPAR